MSGFLHQALPTEMAVAMLSKILWYQLVMVTMLYGSDILNIHRFSSHCGGNGFRMDFYPPTWMYYVRSRSECLIKCSSQEKCAAANFIRNGKSKMVCEMFDYAIWRCNADSNAHSYKQKVRNGKTEMVCRMFDYAIWICCDTLELSIAWYLSVLRFSGRRAYIHPF